MTRTIDMTNIENKHKTYTYNLKNENDVKITNLFTNFLDSIKIKISGNTLSISVLEPMGPVLKFTNISNLKDINLNVYQKQDAHANPDYLNKTFQAMIDDVWAANPENVDYWTIKNRTLTGTNFDDDIDITDPTKYTVVDGIGWTVNSLKGNDTIEGTTGKDTITGGLGKDTIVFSEGNDLVKLTKNEELIIDVSALGLNTPEDIIRAQDDIQASTNKNGDLILTMLNEENTQHQITINKFVKTNGVGTKGKVSLYLGKNEETQDVYYDLNTKAIMYFDEEDASYKKKSNTATLTGTRLGDDISVDGGTINALNNANNAKITIKAGDGNNFINLVNALNTNTITTGVGDDVIEIEDTSDITPSTPKALTTVKAGAGENKITIEGSGNNSIITGKDDDTFNIKGDSISVIKAGGGNNIININDDSFGTVTLAEEKIKNTKNDIVFDESVHLTAAYKSGDNLILKNDGSSLIINGYFLQTGKNAVKTLDGYELANLGDFLEKNGLELSVEGDKKITGTDLPETIMGSDKADTINANGGADKITGGKGKDTINAGAGDNRIIYHTGDGNDTILYGGGEDTLVFDEGMEVSAKYSGKNLLVDYTGKDYTGKDVKNTITIKDFSNNQSVKYIQIGENAPKAIEEYLDGTYISTSANEIWGANGIKLERDNHIFLFDLKNTQTGIYTNNFGSDNISSPNKSTDKYTDTLVFTDFSVQQNLNISYDDDIMTLNPWNYRPTANHEDTSAGHVNYNWVSLNKQKAVVKDSDGQTYNVKFSSNGTKIDNSKLTTNTINLVGKGNPTTVISNAKYNHTATDETDLNYTYNGGHDRIITGGDQATTDKYTVKSALSDTTYLNISENGGEDTMTFSNTNADDIRVLFDVSKTGGVEKSRILYVHKDAVTLDNIKGAVREGVTPFTSGVLVDDTNTTTKIGIDNIVTEDVADIDEDTWYSAVETKVKAWLTKYGKDSVENALWHSPIEDQTALQELIACYSDVKYSDTTGGGGDTTTYTVNDDSYGYDPLVLSGGHNNKVIFSDEYDDCYITSNNTSAYTDTLEITNVAISDKNYISEVLYDSNDTTLTIDTYDTDNNGGYIMYTAANNPNIVIKDTKATYNFSGYKEVKGTSDSRFTLADGNNMVYIKAQTGTSYITSNDDINIIKTEYGEHGAGLNYLYGGGHDVIATASSSNDVYTATIDGNTSVVIYDADGQDTINANGENVRVIFDAGKTTTFKTQGIFIDKTVLSGMTTEEFKNIFSTDKGMNIAEMNINDADTLNVNGSAITFDNWSIDTNNVHAAVAGWLTDNSGYTSVADALEKCTDADLLASLKTCFVDGTYNANA